MSDSMLNSLGVLFVFVMMMGVLALGKYVNKRHDQKHNKK